MSLAKRYHNDIYQKGNLENGRRDFIPLFCFTQSQLVLKNNPMALKKAKKYASLVRTTSASYRIEDENNLEKNSTYC